MSLPIRVTPRPLTPDQFKEFVKEEYASEKEALERIFPAKKKSEDIQKVPNNGIKV